MPPGTPANSREMEDTHASSPVLTTVNPPILDIDDTTQEAGLVSMEMDGLRSTPSDEEGTDHRGQMNSFDSTVNHHSEFHGIIQGTIKQIQDSLSRSSYIDTTLQTRELSENNGLSTAWGLSQGLKIEKQHDESVGRNLNLQWQDFGGKEESGELDLDSDPPAKERGIEESISTLYHTQSTVYGELHLSILVVRKLIHWKHRNYWSLFLLSPLRITQNWMFTLRLNGMDIVIYIGRNTWTCPRTGRLFVIGTWFIMGIYLTGSSVIMDSILTELL